MIDNQRGRRNLSKEQLLALGFKRAELLRPKAEENIEAGREKGRESRWSSPTLDTTTDPIEHVDATQEAADFAGVSRTTAAKYKKVMSEAPEDVRQEVKQGKTSINKAYQTVRPEAAR